MEAGNIVRCGKTGRFIKPDLAAFETTDSFESFEKRVVEQDGTHGKLNLPCMVQPVNLLEVQREIK